MPTKVKKLSIRPTDIFTMTDAFFSPSYDGGEGWVYTVANDSGKACVNSLFPGAPIKWDSPSDDVFPAGWFVADINVFGIMAADQEHRLPMDITKGTSIENITPDGLAFLLVTGVTRQGGRAGYMNLEEAVSIYVPETGSN